MMNCCQFCFNFALNFNSRHYNVASLIQRFSPQTMHVRFNPPTGQFGLTEHRPDVLARMVGRCRLTLSNSR